MKNPDTINGKTPEEIKKGLECCSVMKGCKNRGCPYYDLGGGTVCIPAMSGDALAYIQQLETGIDKTLKLVQSADKQIRGKLIELESRLAQAERERDAAAAALKECGFCVDCMHNDLTAEQEPCHSCLKRMHEKPNWEWRGVCEENTKEDSQ